MNEKKIFQAMSVLLALLSITAMVLYNLLDPSLQSLLTSILLFGPWVVIAIWAFYNMERTGWKLSLVMFGATMFCWVAAFQIAGKRGDYLFELLSIKVAEWLSQLV